MKLIINMAKQNGKEYEDQVMIILCFPAVSLMFFNSILSFLGCFKMLSFLKLYKDPRKKWIKEWLLKEFNL